MNLHRKGRTALVLALVAVVAMAFRVSWNALRDIAGAVGADDTAATLYPFVVDGLMALALIANLVLTGDARRFALRVLGAYTIASLVLNYVHGLLATSLPVGSIYFGSDLVAKVLHHRPASIPAVSTNTEESTETNMKRSTADQPVSTPAPITPNVTVLPRPVRSRGVVWPGAST